MPDQGRKTPQWFPVATHGRYVVAGRDMLWRPATLVHVKQPGAARAACGFVALNWQTFWDVQFSMIGPEDACPSCVAALRAVQPPVPPPEVAP